MIGKNFFLKNNMSEYFIDGFLDDEFNIHINDTLILHIDEHMFYTINIYDIYTYKNKLYCLSSIDMIFEKKYCILMFDNILSVFDISFIDYKHSGLFDWIYKICYFEKYMQYENILLIHIDDAIIYYSLDTFSQCNNMAFNIILSKIYGIINWLYR